MDARSIQEICIGLSIDCQKDNLLVQTCGHVDMRSRAMEKMDVFFL